jgi:hypothetical protein
MRWRRCHRRKHSIKRGRVRLLATRILRRWNDFGERGVAEPGSAAGKVEDGLNDGTSDRSPL